MFFKIGVPKYFAIFTGKHLCWSFFLITKNPTHVLSCEYCKIFKNKFFCRTPLVVASGGIWLIFLLFRGCSYGGQLVRLGGLFHLGEISPSFRNSYKNMCSYLPGSHLADMKIFHMNTRKRANPARKDRVQLINFNQFCFLRLNSVMLIKQYKNICSACMNQTFVVICFSQFNVTLYCKK